MNASCPTSFGRLLLICINIFTAVLGLLLCGGGTYLYVNYETNFQDLVSTTPIISVMICGLVIFMLSILGVYGATSGKPPVLYMYLGLLLGILIILGAATVLFIDYKGFITSSDSTLSTEIIDPTEIAINNFIFRTYQSCCYYDAGICQPLQCEQVLFCDAANSSSAACILDTSANRVDFLESNDVCTALSTFSIDLKFLVGEIEPNNSITCGGGDAALFESAMTQWMTANISFFGYGALGLGILLLLLVLATLGLLFYRPELIIPEAYLVDGEDDQITVVTDDSSFTK